MSTAPLVTKKFVGPTRVRVGISGDRKPIIFKIKDGGWLDINHGNIVGYKGVSPQPYALRSVINIREAEYADPAAKKGTTAEVDEAARKARERMVKKANKEKEAS